MFNWKINLFKLFGFQVSIDASWIIVAVLVTWSLAAGLFPHMYKNLSTTTYWAMGVLGALGLFLSVIVHEFSHSLVGRHVGVPMKGITLFIFGGIAEMNKDPDDAKGEFFMAAAGPLTSLVMGGIFFGLFTLGQSLGWSTPIAGVLKYLAIINGVLALFNLVPAFPLDGGRVLRSILWGIKGDLKWATNISSKIGSGFGLLLMFLGFLNVLGGNFVGGIWWILIGMFLRGAASMGYKQLMMRKALEGESIERFMQTEPVTAPPDISLQDLLEDYIYKHHYKMFPVVKGDELIGCIHSRQIKEIPKEQWNEKTVGEVAGECSEANTIPPDVDPNQVLNKMKEAGTSRLMVVDSGHLAGIISIKDLLEFLSIKMEMEGED